MEASFLASCWMGLDARSVKSAFLAEECLRMHLLQRVVPGSSGASHIKQHTASPISSMARLGSDMHFCHMTN